MRLVIIGNESVEKIHRNQATFDGSLPTLMHRAFTAIQLVYSPGNLLIIIIILFDYE